MSVTTVTVIRHGWTTLNGEGRFPRAGATTELPLTDDRIEVVRSPLAPERRAAVGESLGRVRKAEA